VGHTTRIKRNAVTEENKVLRDKYWPFDPPVSVTVGN